MMQQIFAHVVPLSSRQIKAYSEILSVNLIIQFLVIFMHC